MCWKLRIARFGLGTSLFLFAGCSREMSEAIIEAARAHSQPALPVSHSLDDELVVESIDKDRELIAASVPSPDRTNPFEMSGEFENEYVAEVPGRKREIRVLGFIELDSPSVMLSLDGRSQVFRLGETIEKVTVHEIQPPRARISYDGVTWNASIFDRRTSN